MLTKEEIDRNTRAIAWSGGGSMAVGMLVALVIEATHGGPDATNNVVPRPLYNLTQVICSSEMYSDSTIPGTLPGGGLEATAVPELGFLMSNVVQ